MNPFTPREHEVADLVEDGLSRKEIAEALGITTHTVDKHLANLFKKAGVNTCRKLQLVLQGGSGA